MATATINGITFENLTITEMLALANSTAEKFAPAPVDNSHAEKVAAELPIGQPIVEKPLKGRISTGERKLACGHMQAVKGAGRPPSKCDACKGGNKAEKPAPKRESKRDWTEEPASKSQVSRITRKLDDSRISTSMAKRIRAELGRGVKGGRAREINLALNSALGIS